MIEGIDKGEGRGAIQGSAIIESCSDMDRGLVDVRNAEINLSHVARLITVAGSILQIDPKTQDLVCSVEVSAMSPAWIAGVVVIVISLGRDSAII